MSGNKKFAGKSAIVTGAGSGIGEVTAKLFASHGALVTIADINIQEAQKVVSEISGVGGTAMAIKVDVTQPQEVAQMVRTVVERWSTIDILVNNAGGFTTFSPILEITEEDWDKTLTLNLKSVFVCCQAVAKIMMEKRSGRIINLTSRAGLAPNPGGPDYIPYGAAKAGVMGFTRLLAKALGPYNITVNAVCPSTVATPRVRKIRDEESLRKIAAMGALGKLVEPKDIAEAIFFLASEEASCITGINLNVNAGTFMM